MADSVVKSKTVASTPNAEARRSDTTLPRLRVRYFHKMKPARVHVAEVSWAGAASPQRGEVTVRLIVAGAQVLPSEQTMDAAKPDRKVLFYVTPLAKGWLRNEKLEVISQGRK